MLTATGPRAVSGAVSCMYACEVAWVAIRSRAVSPVSSTVHQRIVWKVRCRRRLVLLSVRPDLKPLNPVLLEASKIPELLRRLAPTPVGWVTHVLSVYWHMACCTLTCKHGEAFLRP